MSRVCGGPGEKLAGGVGVGVAKQLLDENLPVKLTGELRDVLGDIRHVRDLGLQSGSDTALWE